MKATINIKADKEIKEGAQKVAAQMGIPLSTVMNAFLKQFMEEKSVTFSVPFYRPSPTLEKVLAKVDADIKRSRNLSPVFESVEDALSYLHS